MADNEIPYTEVDMGEVGAVQSPDDIGDPIADMIDMIAAQNFNKASETFSDLVGQKVSDALDQERVNVASQIFGEPEEESDETEMSDEELESEEDDMSDEEFDELMADVEDDE